MKIRNVSFMTLAIAASFLMASGASAASFNSYNLPGTTDFDGWDNLTGTNPQVAAASPAFPSFPGATLWPEPIESVLTQDLGTDTSDDDPTGDATFDKTAGNGYPAGVSIYASPFLKPDPNDPNSPGIQPSYSVSDATPVAGLETVVFQIRIGEGSSGFLQGDPTLTVNGGSTTVPLFNSGTVATESGAGFGGGSTIAIDTLGYQWDLSGVSGTINDFDVEFTTAGTSTTIRDLQLDQGSEFEAVPVPEPASVMLLAIGGMALAFRRRPRGS